MRASSSDRFLYAGGAIGALGVILIWRKIGAFWLGGFITAVGCGLTAISYSLRALLARPIERSPRWALPVAAAAFIGLCVVGLLYLSTLSLLGQRAGATTIGNALPILAALFAVFVVLDSFTEREE
jgi:hypothetical protein